MSPALEGKQVSTWTADDVCTYLKSISLESLVDAFRKNGVDGADLISMCRSEYLNDLGCTALQYKKVRNGIRALGAPVPEVEIATAAGTFAPTHTALNPEAAAPAGPSPAAAATMPAAAASVAEQSAAEEADRQKHVRAGKLLCAADNNLCQALNYMQQAKHTAGMAFGGDMMMDAFGMGRPMGFGHLGGEMVDLMANDMENRDLQQADMYVRQAAQQVQDAMRIAPDIPYIEINCVQQLSSGFMSAIFMPTIGEVMRRQQIQRSLQQIASMEQHVQQALQWLAGRYNVQVPNPRAPYGGTASYAPTGSSYTVSRGAQPVQPTGCMGDDDLCCIM